MSNRRALWVTFLVAGVVSMLLAARAGQQGSGWELLGCGVFFAAAYCAVLRLIVVSAQKPESYHKDRTPG